MKLLVNKCDKTIILNPGGRQVELRPKGMPKDRREVTDKFAEHPDIAKFVAKGWLEVLNTTEAAHREASEAKQKATAAASQPAAAAPSAPPASKPVEPPPALPSAVVPHFDETPFSLTLSPDAKPEEKPKAEEKAETKEYTPTRRRR